MRLALRIVAITMTAAACEGCEGLHFSKVLLPGEAVALSVVQGDQQCGAAGQAFPDSVMVRVLDDANHLVPGAGVEVSPTGVKVNDSSGTTTLTSNANGLISFAVQALSVPGSRYESTGSVSCRISSSGQNVTLGFRTTQPHFLMAGRDTNVFVATNPATSVAFPIRVLDACDAPVPNFRVYYFIDSGGTLTHAGDKLSNADGDALMFLDIAFASGGSVVNVLAMDLNTGVYPNTVKFVVRRQ